MFGSEATVSPELVKAMADSIYHRGPDDEGYYVSGPIGLGFRRLSIIDLSEAGRQPMHRGDLTVAFNGEIYNYLELRTELVARGHRFFTKSDTEVLLAAFAEWGDEALSRLNGMFAILLWDKNVWVIGRS